MGTRTRTGNIMEIKPFVSKLHCCGSKSRGVKRQTNSPPGKHILSYYNFIGAWSVDICSEMLDRGVKKTFDLQYMMIKYIFGQ